MTDTMTVPDHRVTWTDERVEMMKKLHAAGLSASGIAKELGGVTRNAVCSKIARHGLGSPFRTPQERANNGPVVRIGRPVQAKFKAEPIITHVVDIEPRHVGLMDLEQTDCRWPYGTGPYTFCGCAKISDGPYCYAHTEVAMPPVQQRQALNRRRA